MWNSLWGRSQIKLGGEEKSTWSSQAKLGAQKTDENLRSKTNTRKI